MASSSGESGLSEPLLNDVAGQPEESNAHAADGTNNEGNTGEGLEFDENLCNYKNSCHLAGAVSNLCSATLGAGILSIPYSFCQAGWVFGFFLLILAAAATYSSIDLLVAACDYYQLSNENGFAGGGYEVLMKKCYPDQPWLRWSVDFSVCFFCIGCAVAYLIAVGDIAEQSHLLLFGGNRPITMIFIWCFTMLPLSCSPQIRYLQWSSALGIASIVTLILAATVHFVQAHGESEGASGHAGSTEEFFYTGDIAEQDIADGFLEFVHNIDDNGNTTHTVWSTFGDYIWPQNGFFSVMRACPIILFAFSCQVNVCAIYSELPVMHIVDSGESDEEGENIPLFSKRSPMQFVAANAVALCGLLYGALSIISILDLGGAPPNLLNGYKLHNSHGGHGITNRTSNDTNTDDATGSDDLDQTNIVMQVAAMCVVIAVIFAFPLNILPARDALTTYFHSSKQAAAATGDNDATSPLLQGQRQEGETADTRVETNQQPPEEEGEEDEEPLYYDTNNDPNTSDVIADRRGRKKQGDKYADAVFQTYGYEQPKDNVDFVENEDVLGDEEEEEEQDAAAQDVEERQENSGSNGSRMVLTWYEHILWTVGISGIALLFALVVPDISVVFGLLGGTVCSFLGFCLPGLVGIHLVRQLLADLDDEIEDEEERDEQLNEAMAHILTTLNRTWIISWLLVIGGVCTGIVTTAVTISALF